MMRIHLVAALLFLAGCVSTSRIQPSGDLIFYVKTTEGAFSGIKEKKEGYFFYLDRMGSIVGYEYDDGIVVDVFGGGSAVGDLISEIGSIKLTGLDFHKELKEARERLEIENENAKNEDDNTSFILVPFALDGAEYEIYADFMGSEFKFRAWNPRVDIEYFSSREEVFRRLNQWMEAFTNYYGKSKIHY